MHEVDNPILQAGRSRRNSANEERQQEANSQASNCISISVGYLYCELLLLQIANNLRHMSTRQRRNKFKKVMIKLGNCVIVHFAFIVSSQPGAAQHRQKNQFLEIVLELHCLTKELFMQLILLPRERGECL